MDMPTIIAAICAIIVMVGGYVLIGDGPSVTQQRMEALVGRDKSGKNNPIFKFMKSDDNSSRRKQIEESLGDIENKQKTKKQKRKSLKSKLIQANMTITAPVFNAMSIAIGAAIGVATFTFTNNPLVSLAAAFGIGFGIPRFILNVIIGRRQKAFVGHFADAMDIIVRGVRTGLPLGDCVKIIAHESPEPVGSEFTLVVEGEAVGVPIEVCLERMYERMPVSEVNFFATVLNIQRTTGGNLAEALDNLSNVLRGRKLLAEKIKALSAEAKMSAIIIGALPLVVMALVSIASPEYMTELYTTETGHRNMMIGAGMMVFGTLMMKKMINFKY